MISDYIGGWKMIVGSVAGEGNRGGVGACPQETVRFSRIQVCPKDTPERSENEPAINIKGGR